MFSRMMRRPAGLVQKALRKTFGAPLLAVAPAARPQYWHSRFSHPGFSLEAPPPVIAAVEPAPAQWAGPGDFDRHLLAKQRGRAASFLGEPG